MVSDDAEVCTWAREFGAVPISVMARGLNASLTEALPTVVADVGPEFLAIVHADLPLVDGLEDLIRRAATEDRPLIVTDLHGDGTNVLVARASHIESVGFHYGPGSASRHVAEFARVGLQCTVITHDSLSLDLDTPADLDHPLIQPIIERIVRNPTSDPSDSSDRDRSFDPRTS